jgi:hypothetical protein
VPNYFLALAAMALGEKDEAFAQLEKEVADRGAYTSGLDVDPNMDDFRSDPRFDALLSKIQAAKID